ncbi:tRNA threonylcarbamoyladenosine dehydratase [Azospira restricta]|uniref:tRNA threonylcarbamoyladenosine dehydratase n=1 Tax=Azospira restricta TaxID=404405 RepID=A0A974Y5A6_9RHOO|nr:tRNA threonylcarbamoyladenosine dehydratase [Azospira restricta]QRJ65151.1 tRNA threonylcarbamoyladenosine dehydratase [Azospira restricta]
MDADLERRFGGIARLHGAATLARYRAAHVCVVGIGGVGSWTVEALARSGVGRLTLIDLDHVAESNMNRQAHALDENLGKAKVTAMAERIRGINPECAVTEIEEFVTPENAATLLAGEFAVVVDAIDQVRAKVAMIAHCRARRMPIVVAGGAGGKSDPCRIRIDDLARTEQDPLLAKVRAQLRKAHGFTRDAKKRFGVAAVYSSEPIQPPVAAACDLPATGAGGLNCAGFGSSISITASFGLFAASAALQHLREAR